ARARPGLPRRAGPPRPPARRGPGRRTHAPTDKPDVELIAAGHLDRPEAGVPPPPLDWGPIAEVCDYPRPACPHRREPSAAPQQIVDPILGLHSQMALFDA
ncbi:MAG: hypothetical protein ACRD0D_01060, partial [Acidimicrobiales bacterium]